MRTCAIARYAQANVSVVGRRRLGRYWLPLLRLLRGSVVKVRVHLVVSIALVRMHRLPPGLAFRCDRVNIVHVLRCRCEVVCRDNLTALPLVGRAALFLLLLVGIGPVRKAAVSRFVANLAVELRVRVVHAHEAFVFGGFCALEHNQFLVERG